MGFEARRGSKGLPLSWRPGLSLLIIGFCFLSTPLRDWAANAAQQPLTNQDVITMIQAGISPEVIIEKIKMSKTNFDTSTDALVALKSAGASSEIIRIVVNPAAETKSSVVVSPWANANAPQPCQAPPGGGPLPWLSGASPAMWKVDPDSGGRTEINYEHGTITHVGFYGFGARLLVLHPLKAGLRVAGRAQFASCLNPSEAPLVRFSLDPGSDERNTSVGRTTPWNTSFSISHEDLAKPPASNRQEKDSPALASG
ncbi:MAG TPA: hypothetical protein VHR45_00515 [Thermoanaerobaculia bacterium]|nr:hypothetical protein [Thermoanaerobaculia bacterium]